LTLRGFDRRSGASFSMTWLNAALQTESDKLLIGLFGGPAAMAVYGVASRLMDGAAMPPRALRVAFQSRLYREGAVGHASTFRLTVQLLPLAVIYGVAVWMGFWLMAPFIAWVFGDGFEQLTAILPILGALPLLRSVSDYGAEIFVASDRPGVQAWTQTFATAIRIVLGIVLIGAFGLIGAVSAALLMSFVSGLFLWALAIRLNRNAVRTRGSAP
jgi:O-antigen/teichoic acid export membrane protein